MPGRIRQSHRNRHANRTRFGTFMIFIFLGLLGAFMILPLLYGILNAFKPLEEIYIYPPRFFVRNPTLEDVYKRQTLAI